MYQVRRFLNYLGCEWTPHMRPPKEQRSSPPKYITEQDIAQSIEHFKDNPHAKLLLYLGCDTGMRATELYRLKKEDISGNMIRIDHTKTGVPRITFFTDRTKEILEEYLSHYELHFRKRWIQNMFQHLPIQVKDFRKYFSQQWDRKNGATSVKKILMGHSLKGDVDLMHYNCQNQEDLKKIYDRVMTPRCSQYDFDTKSETDNRIISARRL